MSFVSAGMFGHDYTDTESTYPDSEDPYGQHVKAVSESTRGSPPPSGIKPSQRKSLIVGMDSSSLNSIASQAQSNFTLDNSRFGKDCLPSFGELVPDCNDSCHQGLMMNKIQ